MPDRQGPLITRPVRAWGRLGRSQQFTLYMRGSLQAVVIFLMATAVLVVWNNPALNLDYLWVLVLDAVWIAALTTVAVVFLHRVPGLRVEAMSFRADTSRWASEPPARRCSSDWRSSSPKPPRTSGCATCSWGWL